MSEQEARAIIGMIRKEVEDAADMMLSAAEKGLRDVYSARAGNAAALMRVERTLCAILEACAFHDLTGQRLSKLEAMVGGVSLTTVKADPLLNGPAMPGAGLDQAAADELFRSVK